MQVSDTPRISRTLGSVAVLLAAFALTGCGGSSDTSADSAAETGAGTVEEVEASGPGGPESYANLHPETDDFTGHAKACSTLLGEPVELGEKLGYDLVLYDQVLNKCEYSVDGQTNVTLGIFAGENPDPLTNQEEGSLIGFGDAYLIAMSANSDEVQSDLTSHKADLEAWLTLRANGITA